MRPLDLPSLSPYQVAFDLEDGRLVLVEIIPTLIEGLKDTFQLQGRAWQINDDGSRYIDDEGHAVITPTKKRMVSVTPDDSSLHDEMADAAATLLEQFKLHAQLREAFRQKKTLLPIDPDQDRF
jgi:hypothetical protein